MTTFVQGNTINLSLDYDDYVTFSGSGTVTVTPYSGSSWQTYLTGNQTIGPFRTPSTSVSIACTSDGSYTVASENGVNQIRVTPSLNAASLGRSGDGSKYYVPKYASKKLASVMNQLDGGENPVNITVLGDSTGDDPDEWVYLMASALAAKYPTHTVNYRLYDGPNHTNTDQYNPVSILNVGSSGYRYFTRNLTAPPGPVMQITDSAVISLVGDHDVRCKVNLGGQANTLSGTLCGKYGAAGQKSWRFELSGGYLLWGHTADGTNEVSARSSSVQLSAAQMSQDIWLRATLQVNNGAAGNTVTFYTSLDGTNWTALGTPQTAAGTTSVFDSTTSTQFCGRGGNSSSLASTAEVKFYEFQVFGALDGTNKVIHFDAGGLPLLQSAGPTLSFLDDCGNPATFYMNAGGTMGGSPRLAIFNGSVGGQIISYAYDATRYPKICGSTPDLCFINYGHNEGTGISYQSSYKTLTDKLVVTNPYMCIVGITQNKRLPVAGVVYEHKVRMRQVAQFCSSQGFDVIDTYTNWPTVYTRSDDGTHPSTPEGKNYWSGIVNQYMGL